MAGDTPGTRDRLLAAATQLLDELGGGDDVTVRAIVDRAGISQGAFYLHFRSRDELLYETAYRSLGASEAALERRLVDVADPLERLMLRGESYLDWALQNPVLYMIVFGGTGRESTPDRFDDVTTMADTNLAPLLADVRAAMAAGSIPEGDAEALTALLWMTEHGYASLIISVPDFPWPSSASLRAVWQNFTDWGIRAQRHPADVD